MGFALQEGGRRSQRADDTTVVIEHDGSIISRDVISDWHTTEFRMVPFFGQNEQSTCIVARTIMYLCNIIFISPKKKIHNDICLQKRDSLHVQTGK